MMRSVVKVTHFAELSNRQAQAQAIGEQLPHAAVDALAAVTASHRRLRSGQKQNGGAKNGYSG